MTSFFSLLPDQSAGTWLLVAGAALIVGFSKAALPGAGSIAAGMFALALPAKESTAALLVLLILGDVTALWMYRRDPDWRTLARLVPGVLVGLVIGAFFLALADGVVVRRAIGVILLALVVLTVWRRRVGGPKPSADATDGEAGAARSGTATGRLTRVAYGSLGGFTTMVANAGGPVMSMYFYAMRMPVLTFLGTSAWFFAIVNVLKLPFSASIGLFRPEYLWMDLLLAPLVVISAVIGRAVASHVPQTVFEKAVLVLTVVSAATLLV